MKKKSYIIYIGLYTCNYILIEFNKSIRKRDKTSLNDEKGKSFSAISKKWINFLKYSTISIYFEA